MYHLNRVVLVGRVGQDPEIRYLDNNVAVGKFSLATSDRYMGKDGQWVDKPTEWHDIVVWRHLAERAGKELKKGKLVYVEGAISYRKWEDKDGNSRKSIDIVARQFRALETPPSSGSNFPTMANDPKSAATPATNNNTSTPPTSAPVANKPAVNKEFEDQPDDDLPF
ncbi:MAG: single-stranded DNA-binding protein [Saprospiraceae bacterium]